MTMVSDKTGDCVTLVHNVFEMNVSRAVESHRIWNYFQNASLCSSIIRLQNLVSFTYWWCTAFLLLSELNFTECASPSYTLLLYREWTAAAVTHTEQMGSRDAKTVATGKPGQRSRKAPTHPSLKVTSINWSRPTQLCQKRKVTSVALVFLCVNISFKMQPWVKMQLSYNDF